MATLISTNPADNYSKVGEVDVSTDKEIADKVYKANKAGTVSGKSHSRE